VQQAEDERNEPRHALGEPRVAAPRHSDFAGEEGDAQRDRGLHGRARQCEPSQGRGHERDAVRHGERGDREQDAPTAPHDDQQGQHEKQVVDAEQDVLDSEQDVGTRDFQLAA